jgi:hypothetical protein
MVERRAEPIRGDPSGVASYASGWVLCGNVIRYRAAERLRAQPGRLVASVAICVRGRKRVVVVDVARRARRGHVRTLQRPPRRAVIKFAVSPEQRVVAGRALRSRETCRNVIRHHSTECLRAHPGRLVAPVTIRICGGESVIVPDVAIRAGHHFSGRHKLVGTRQRPAGGAVIEGRCSPRDRVMAGGAVRGRKWRPGSWVRRIIRGLPGRQVTLGISTVRRRNRKAVVVVDMARRASHDFTGGRELVRIRQRKARRGVVER